MLDAETRIAADDVLVFAACEAGIETLWTSPLFGLPPHRLFAVTVKAGETGTLHDFECDGTLRLVAARTTTPLHETELVPGETCYVAGESAAAVADNQAV